MGKRTSFERREADFYPTPFKAVPPLIPYLRRDGIKTFAELCCGEGDLIRHLESFGLKCVHSGDIRTGQDALAVKRYIGRPDAGITNPPFADPNGPKRNTILLRNLIQQFLDLGVPFWLLLPHDWSANKGSRQFLRRCTDIIAIGRIKWIPNSEYSGGYENSTWVRFDPNYRGDPAFHNDRGLRAQIKQVSSIAEAAE
jgi:hypothetical protein